MKNRSALLAISLPLVVLLMGAASQPPPDLTILARSGSYAPWGENHYLFIDSLGNATFYRSWLDSAAVDSVVVSIPAESLGAIYDTILAVQLADLDSLYDGGLEDGSGISLKVTAEGAVTSVEAVNATVPEVDRVARTINRILMPYGILLRYDSITDSLTN